MKRAIMDFSDALRAMKAGKKVQRQVWINGQASWKGAFAMIMTMPAPFEPQIVIGYADNDHVLRPFSGAQWDILSMTERSSASGHNSTACGIVGSSKPEEGTKKMLSSLITAVIVVVLSAAFLGAYAVATA